MTTLIKDIDTLINVGCSRYLFCRCIVIISQCYHGTRVAELFARSLGEREIAGSIPVQLTNL